MKLSRKQQKLLPFYASLLLCVYIGVYPFASNTIKRNVEFLLVGKINIALVVVVCALLFKKQPLLFILAMLFIIEVNMLSYKQKKENFRTYFGLEKIPCVY